VRCDNIELV